MADLQAHRNIPPDRQTPNSTSDPHARSNYEDKLRIQVRSLFHLQQEYLKNRCPVVLVDLNACGRRHALACGGPDLAVGVRGVLTACRLHVVDQTLQSESF